LGVANWLKRVQPLEGKGRKLFCHQGRKAGEESPRRLSVTWGVKDNPGVKLPYGPETNLNKSRPNAGTGKKKFKKKKKTRGEV